MTQAHIFIAQTRRFHPRHDRVAGELGQECKLVAFHKTFHLVSPFPTWDEHQETLEMMKRVKRIVHFVVVKERQLVVGIRRARRAIERGFVKIDRLQIIPLARLRIRIVGQLRLPLGDHPIATGKCA